MPLAVAVIAFFVINGIYAAMRRTVVRNAG